MTMLASGMYFDGESSASMNTAMNGALASFLQTQVNAITGKALNSMGLDLTANMESAADVMVTYTPTIPQVLQALVE